MKTIITLSLIIMSIITTFGQNRAISLLDLENSVWQFNDDHTVNVISTEKLLMKGQTVRYHNAVIQKSKYDADNLYFIHFKVKIKPQNFNNDIDGVESIWQQSKEPLSENKHQYTIIVEVGLAFNQLEVLKKVIDSKH